MIKPFEHQQNKLLLSSLPTSGFLKNLTTSVSMNYKTQKQAPNKSLTLASLFNRERDNNKIDPQATLIANRNSWKDLIKYRFDMFKTFIQKATFIKKGTLILKEKK